MRIYDFPLVSGCLAPFGANVGLARYRGSYSTGQLRPSEHFVDGKFLNPIQTSVANPKDFGKIFRQMVAGQEIRTPRRPIPIVRRTREDYATPPASGLRATWIGHASTLLEIDGRRVLLDPVWSERCSPFSGIGPARFHPPPIALEDLPPLDAVIVSHDHYDHLDFQTVRSLARLDVPFVVPIGVGAHLKLWGVSSDRIIELDWHDRTTVAELQITALPARHFSGRWIRDRNATLWASWSIVGPSHRVFYSGDSGYFDGFRDIGTRYGPFDLTIIAIGAYAEEWAAVHLNPEEAVAVHRDVRGRMMLPVHWGTFHLALHSWFDPADRLVAAIQGTDIVTAIPMAGQWVEPSVPPPIERWWMP